MLRVSFSLRSVILVIAVLVAVASASPLDAQPPQQGQPQWQWPEHPKNLKVLPKDIKSEQLQATMIGFTRALGVRCPFCHVGEEGKPLSTFDFVSDGKLQKQIARRMVLMVGDIHKDLKKAGLSPGPRVNVGCITCHHGRPRPATLAEEMTIAYDKGGIDSAFATYDDLRARFYGRNSYDFGEAGLVEFADALRQKGKIPDAVRVFEKNAEIFPQSLRALEGVASAYEATNQNDKAIATYKKMLEIDPQNRNAQRHLDALQGNAPK
jgi:Photosynthetic reaction centre cytochrome C subunit/Tetratricopeptide repeat